MEDNDTGIDPGVLDFIHPTTDSDGNVHVEASVAMVNPEELH